MSLIDFYDRNALEAWRKQKKVAPEFIRRLRVGLCKRFFADDQLPKLQTQAKDGGTNAGDIQLHWLQVVQQVDSNIDGATKLLLKTSQGMLIESVLLRIDTGRTSLCVSSQVGCAAACEFCATGKMGVAKNLTASEIVDQVVLAGQRLALEDRKVRNIVFMGMGEPFHNEQELFKALDLLTAPDVFCHPPSRILVSTVGIADAMLRFAERYPKINLALSLHSVDQATRERIIPVARKYPLDLLRETLAEINRLQSGPIMIEYLMLEGVNDAETDADAFVQWLDQLNVHVNLIPYNPIQDAPNLSATPKATILRFADRLKSAGVNTTTRYSLGRDIAAACGQLVQQENRRIASTLS